MFRTLSIAAIALSAFAATASTADAGGCNKGGGRWRPVPPVHPPAPAVRPIQWHPQPVVQPQRDWYFGMSLEIVNTQYGRGLKVASVTHHAPAHRAGLEVGDVLLVAGQTSLANAISNEHGVTLINQAMGFGQAPAPAAAATFGQVAYVQPTSQLQLTVLNRRTGQPVYVTIAPQRVGGPAPAIAAPAFPQPAFPQPTYPQPAAPAQTF